jgi:hypothetical protein
MREKTTITHEDFLELSSDIAEAIAENILGVLIWEVNEDGSEHLTGQSQDVFIEYLEIVQNCLHSHFKPTNQ